MSEFKQKFEERVEVVETKVKTTARKVKNDVTKIWNWMKDNPKEALILSTGFVTAVGGLCKGVAKVGNMVQDAQEKKDSEKRIWNPVAGEYLYTKKPMTGRQKLEFEQRIASGEPRAQILHDMGLLDKRK